MFINSALSNEIYPILFLSWGNSGFLLFHSAHLILFLLSQLPSPLYSTPCWSYFLMPVSWETKQRRQHASLISVPMFPQAFLPVPLSVTLTPLRRNCAVQGCFIFLVSLHSDSTMNNVQYVHFRLHPSSSYFTGI